VSVMQMNFDLAVAARAEQRELIEMLGSVHLRREEERVLWRPAIRIDEPIDRCRVASQPRGDAVSLALDRHLPVIRLVVIADAEEDVDRPRRLATEETTQLPPQVCGHPPLGMIRKREHCR